MKKVNRSSSTANAQKLNNQHFNPIANSYARAVAKAHSETSPPSATIHSIDRNRKRQRVRTFSDDSVVYNPLADRLNVDASPCQRNIPHQDSGSDEERMLPII